MPGHFTHIYAARRVADLLASGKFSDWPHATDAGVNALRNYDPVFCGKIMQKWEKFSAVGAVGPDLFFYSQDYNSDTIGPHSDRLMLALATYYYFDAALEDDWEPLLVILAEVNEEMVLILRILIKLQKAWDEFVAGWNATVGPVVDAIGEVADNLLGGLLSQFKVVLEELKDALIQIGEEELVTYKDIWGYLDTCVQKGWQEDSFLWSDMSHYRRTSAMAEALVDEAERLKIGEDGQNRYEQFLAFALGYVTHLGIDTVAHSWVNTQCGGPFRNHPARHHVIESHVDSWNYKNAGFDPHPIAEPCPKDPWAATEDYPDISTSALWFAVQMTPDDPHGQQRPAPAPQDPAARKEALDVDGEMPLWMAESIVRAMKSAFEGHPHPKIYGGDAFQTSIDEGFLTDIVKKVTGHELDKPFDDLLKGIAPPPPDDLTVPQGFPLPWQIQTMYRLMITQYKLSYNGTWELEKPKKPPFIIFPPVSDFTDLFQPPDFSGVDSSNPLIDVCEAIIALVEWAVKQLGDALKLLGDLIKMGASPFSYPLRYGLWLLAMKVWDVTMKTHDLMAHTGFFFPHAEQLYPNGELRLPNEIDLPLITLGSSVDSAFKQALADAIDPLGNLDKDPTVIAGDHPVPDLRYPLYPVLRHHLDALGHLDRPPEGWEYRRPWAYPDVSLFTPAGSDNVQIPTPTESYDPSKSDPTAPAGPFKPLRAGPYGPTRPDHVYFRTEAPVNRDARTAYENAHTPAETDRLNERFIARRLGISPLGDPVPFSAYLIGRLANRTGYRTQFNLDSDRGYAYLTWDWIRGKESEHENGGMHNYVPPVVRPPGDDHWIPETSSLSTVGAAPLQLRYVDPPLRRIRDLRDDEPIAKKSRAKTAPKTSPGE